MYLDSVIYFLYSFYFLVRPPGFHSTAGVKGEIGGNLKVSLAFDSTKNTLSKEETSWFMYYYFRGVK